jgi:hypothetical protein
MPLHIAHLTSTPVIEHIGAVPSQAAKVPSRRAALEALDKITLILEDQGHLPGQIFDELETLRLFVELR